MKKSISVVSIIAVLLIIMTFAACTDGMITPNEPYDMSDGVKIGEYREINITVASYNIKGGGATLESIRRVNENIISVGADIAGLQEVDNLSKRSGKKDFLQIFRDGVMSNVTYFPIMLKGFGETYGIAEVSKTPFSKAHSFKLPYPYQYEKDNVEKRIIMRSLIEIDGVQVAFYNTHLAYEEVKMPDGKSLRQAQMEYILELLESDPCPYKIVTGDFNVLSFDEFDVLTEGGYKIVNNSENRFDTYRGSDANFLAIDNIIYSESLELVNAGKNDSDCSDHNMLYATFKTVNI